jgi:hypothetical protein
MLFYAEEEVENVIVLHRTDAHNMNFDNCSALPQNENRPYDIDFDPILLRSAIQT